MSAAAVAAVAAACGRSTLVDGSPTTLPPPTTSPLASTPPPAPTTTAAAELQVDSDAVAAEEPPATTTTEPDPEPLRVVEVAPGELRAAMVAARPGDELRLLAGEHTGFAVVAGVSGTSANPIVLRGTEGAVLRQAMLRFAGSEHWRLRGLRFEGQLVAPASVWINDGRGLEEGPQTPSRFITVADTQFVNVRRGERKDTHAIRVDGGSEDVLIERCISDTTSADAVQIQNAQRVTMKDCHFFIRRPFPASDPWDNTGENALDIKRASDIVVRGCLIEGFQAVDSDNIESTSAGAEGIVIHKFGVQGLLVEDCEFRGNRKDIRVTARTKLGDIKDVRDYAKDGLWSRDITVRNCRFVGGPAGHDPASLGAEFAIEATPGDEELLRYVDAPAVVPEVVVTNCTFEGSYSRGALVTTTKGAFSGRIVES